MPATRAGPRISHLSADHRCCHLKVPSDNLADLQCSKFIIYAHIPAMRHRAEELGLLTLLLDDVPALAYCPGRGCYSISKTEVCTRPDSQRYTYNRLSLCPKHSWLKQVHHFIIEQSVEENVRRLNQERAAQLPQGAATSTVVPRSEAQTLSLRSAAVADTCSQDLFLGHLQMLCMHLNNVTSMTLAQLLAYVDTSFCGVRHD